MPPAAEPWAALPCERKVRIALRVGVFVVSAAALLVACRQGTSLFTVGFIFVLYVAAATLWIRGQYQASVDAVREDDETKRPWTLPYKISGPAAAAGFVAALLGAALNFSTALLAGVLMTYLGLGYALMRFRMYAGNGAAERVKWAERAHPPKTTRMRSRSLSPRPVRRQIPHAIWSRLTRASTSCARTRRRSGPAARSPT